MSPPGARNPQFEQMAHESMVRNLTAQAEAIWPLERRLVGDYRLAERASVLDIGCGTGEIALRLAREYPGFQITGVDLYEPHLALARERARSSGTPVHFQSGDAFALAFPDESFDLTLCRHLLQAVPDPWLVLAEMKRVTRPGGRMHVVAEDYGMIHAHPCAIDVERFFRDGPVVFGERTGTDLLGGRKVHGWLSALGLEDVRVDLLPIDTAHVDRDLLRRIFEAWRDGYTDAIATHSRFDRDEVRASFEAILTSLRDPAAWTAWLLPVASAVVPA